MTPESNLTVKIFALLRLKTELWCLKVPEKQKIGQIGINSYMEKNVFFTTNNALKNAVYNLCLLVRGSSKSDG